jgi:glycosyltransferase involved in cell wall biosynthesis
VRPGQIAVDTLVRPASGRSVRERPLVRPISQRSIPVLIDGRQLTGLGATRGFGRYLRSLLPELASKREVSVSVLITPKELDRLPEGIRGIAVHRLRPGRFEDMEHRILVPLDIARHQSGLFHSAAAERPPRMCAHPWVHTIHDVPLSFAGADSSRELRTWRQRRERVRFADAVIAVSRYVAAGAIEQLGLDPARVHVIPHGVSAAFSPGPERPPGTGQPVTASPYLLFVTDHAPHKGFGEAIALISALAERGLPHRLVHVGRILPWSRPTVDSLMARTAHPERVEFAGPANDETLARWYRGADALVVTSRAEGFGLPAVEGMACGTPVLAFDNSALREVVGDGGLMSPDGDVPALAEAVMGLVSNPDRWRAASAAAYRRSRSFSWETCATAHVQVFNEAFARANRGPSFLRQLRSRG